MGHSDQRSWETLWPSLTHFPLLWCASISGLCDTSHFHFISISGVSASPTCYNLAHHNRTVAFLQLGVFTWWFKKKIFLCRSLSVVCYSSLASCLSSVHVVTSIHAPLFFIRALHCKTQMRCSDIPGVQSLPFDWRAAPLHSGSVCNKQQRTVIYIYLKKYEGKESQT